MSSQLENETADVSSSSPSSSSSLVHLRGCDAFPKHQLSCPLECDGIEGIDGSSAAATAASSFPLLPGEYLIHAGHAGSSIIALSNYRLLLHRSMESGHAGQDGGGGQGIVNVPLGLLEQIECRDIFFLHITCKDAKRIRCMFDTNEACLEWCKRLVSAVAPPKRIENILAFAHYAWMHEDNIDLHQTLVDAAFPRGLWPATTAEGRSHDGMRRKFFEDEVRRMGFELNTAWRITNVNEDFALCASYPLELIVPASVKDEDLKKVAQFRSSQRFPVIVWRHQENGCVIARCSQPEVGFLSYREAKDEALVRAIGTACAIDGLMSRNDLPLEEDADGDGVRGDDARGAAVIPTVLIMDARSYAAAVANKLKGGGSECSEYYPNCEVQFMGLANIHSIRKSFQSVRTLCAAYSDHPYWFSGLENTKWLHHIGGLLRSAVVVASAVDRDRRPVLVHCSDGWDRTPQIVALAELLLDPHYRTIDGFQVLVEREWLDFGHKFGDRCGHSVGAEDVNERCPVFLQWLDCVHQLLTQFPCAFEFNANYLVKLSHHVYSCLYGTFLCNSEQERTKHNVRLLTHSIWALLRYNQTRYRNYLYARKESVLWPSCLMRDLVFWSDMYLESIDSVRDEDPPISASSSQPPPSSSHLIESNGPTALTEISGLRPPTETNIGSLSMEKSDAVNCSGGSLTKTRSCANLSSDFMLPTAPITRRRSSDPNFNEQSIIMAKNCDDLSDSMVCFGNVAGSAGHVGEFEEASSNKTAANAVQSEPDSESKETTTVTEGRLELQPFLAIESSTDTIVEDVTLLALNPEIHKSPEHAYATRCKLEYDAECSLHASTSTTDISDSHVTVNRKACQQHDAHSRRYIDLATLEKASSNNRAVTCATAEQMDLVRHFLYFTPSASTPGHSRTPSSGFPATPSDERPVDGCCSGGCAGGSSVGRGGGNGAGTGGVSSASSTSSSSSAAGAAAASSLSRRLDVDGLPLLSDEVQQRLHDVLTEEQRRLNSLQHSLCLAKIALCQQVCVRCNISIHNLEHPEEVRSLPDSVGSGCGEGMSLGHANSNGNTSDVSWEQVEERDTRPTLWVPDHAVTRCMGCDSEFCIVKRKHHCRNCGKIFCADCSSQMTPIPNEQLYHPVRVCTFCFCELGGSVKEEFAAEQWVQRTAAQDSD